MPDPKKFVARLVTLHMTTTSKNGMCGFSDTTCDGVVPQDVAWQKDWGTLYAQLLRAVSAYDAKINDHWVELDLVVEKTISTVIPRLLGPLDIKPSLIHGDIYEGNIGIDRDSGNILIFDASSFYAYNEMELGLWRWNSVMGHFTESYLEICRPK